MIRPARARAGIPPLVAWRQERPLRRLDRDRGQGESARRGAHRDVDDMAILRFHIKRGHLDGPSRAGPRGVLEIDRIIAHVRKRIDPPASPIGSSLMNRPSCGS
jgi:hypothetical protein